METEAQCTATAMDIGQSDDVELEHTEVQTFGCVGDLDAT